jgi:hypothetical protein
MSQRGGIRIRAHNTSPSLWLAQASDWSNVCRPHYRTMCTEKSQSQDGDFVKQKGRTPECIIFLSSTRVLRRQVMVSSRGRVDSSSGVDSCSVRTSRVHQATSHDASARIEARSSMTRKDEKKSTIELRKSIRKVDSSCSDGG